MPVPNGKPGDTPLSDLVVHGRHPFPQDIEAMLLRIDKLGRRPDRWPLGENWPYSACECDWERERGRNLDAARQMLRHLIAMLEAGRGDELLLDPSTGKSSADRS
jgi:hypothetical protein